MTGRHARRGRAVAGGGSPSAAFAWLVAWLVALVVATPLTDDDLINHQIRATAAATHESLADLILRYTRAWMNNEGRFFPGSITWSFSLHWFTGSVIEYKLVLGLVLAVSFAITVVAVRSITESRELGNFAGAALISLLQMRVGFDPMSDFAGLLPLVAGLVLGSLAIVLRRSGWRWMLLAAGMYSFAVLTYETSVAFAPALILVVILRRRGWRSAAAFAVPAGTQLAIVAVLRSRLAHDPSPAYQISMDPSVIGRTFWRQASGAIPLSQWILGDGLAPAISRGAVALSIVIVMVPVFILARRAIFTATPVDRSSLVSLFVLGLWMILCAAGIVALTARWQSELIPGSAYLPVYFEYVGLALIVVSVAEAVRRHLTGRSALLCRIWSEGVSILVTVGAVLTFAGNLTVAGATS